LGDELVKFLAASLIAIVCIYTKPAKAQSLCGSLFTDITAIEKSYSQQFAPQQSKFQIIFRAIHSWFVGGPLSKARITEINNYSDLRDFYNVDNLPNLPFADQVFINGKKIKLAEELLSAKGIHYGIIHGEQIFDSEQKYKNIDDPNFVAIIILPTDDSPLNILAKDVFVKYGRQIAYFPYYNRIRNAEAAVYNNFMLINYQVILENFDLARNYILTHEIEHLSALETDLKIKRIDNKDNSSLLPVAANYPIMAVSEMDAYMRTVRALLGKVLKDLRTSRNINPSDIESLQYFSLVISQASQVVKNTNTDPTLIVSFSVRKFDPELFQSRLAEEQLRAVMIQAQAQVMEAILYNLNPETNATQLRKTLLSLLSVIGKYDPLEKNSFLDFYQLYLENLNIDADPQ
jgi:hypothetical protein